MSTIEEIAAQGEILVDLHTKCKQQKAINKTRAIQRGQSSATFGRRNYPAPRIAAIPWLGIGEM